MGFLKILSLLWVKCSARRQSALWQRWTGPALEDNSCDGGVLVVRLAAACCLLSAALLVREPPAAAQRPRLLQYTPALPLLTPWRVLPALPQREPFAFSSPSQSCMKSPISS